MQSLANKHKIVARYLALGASLKEICATYGLSYATWSRVVSEPIFQEELHRVQQELEDRMLEDAVHDPVFVGLKTNAVNAVNLLVEELTNNDPSSGGSASTRIKAATSILDRAGYNSAPSQQTNNTIVFHLSKEKLELVHGTAVKPGEQPDSIGG